MKGTLRVCYNTNQVSFRTSRLWPDISPFHIRQKKNKFSPRWFKRQSILVDSDSKRWRSRRHRLLKCNTALSYPREGSKVSVLVSSSRQENTGPFHHDIVRSLLKGVMRPSKTWGYLVWFPRTQNWFEGSCYLVPAEREILKERQRFMPDGKCFSTHWSPGSFPYDYANC